MPAGLRRTRLLLAAGLVLGPQLFVFSTPTYRLILSQEYPDAPSAAPGFLTSTAACNTCHYVGEGPEVNLFGAQFQQSNYDFAAIAGLDADDDGIRNEDELLAGTNPAVDTMRLALFLAGSPALAKEQFPNVNGDRGLDGREIIDAADLVFRYQGDARRDAAMHHGFVGD